MSGRSIKKQLLHVGKYFPLEPNDETGYAIKISVCIRAARASKTVVLIKTDASI